MQQCVQTLIIKPVTFCLFWLNSLLPKGGVSWTYNLRTSILGTTVRQRLHCHLPFNSYTRTLTTPAICLGPTGNSHSNYHLFSLNTGAVIHQYRWTELPLAPLTVYRVHHMATHDSQPGGLKFCNRTEILLERTAADEFDQLTSHHQAHLLNHLGFLVNSQPGDTSGPHSVNCHKILEKPSRETKRKTRQKNHM